MQWDRSHGATQMLLASIVTCRDSYILFDYAVEGFISYHCKLDLLIVQYTNRDSFVTVLF